MVPGQHGMTSNTLKHIALGAGTIHKGLNLESGNFNFADTVLCATSGGNSLEITNTLYDIPIDGVGVKTYGATVKVGEAATLTVNAVEMTPEILNAALFTSMSNTQAIEGYSMGYTGESIDDSKHYVSNLAYVGEIAKTGKPIIIIFDKALCTSGLKVDGKNQEADVLPLTFEAYKGYQDSSRMTSLGIRIYYPETIPTVPANVESNG